MGLLAIPALAFQAPLWIWYRRMDFFKQRLLSAADPIVGFVVAVGLAIAGAGYWALVVGLLAGALSTSVLAVVTSPYRLRVRLDGAVAREYVRFSLPLLGASMAGLIIAQGSIVATSATLGVAGAGVVALSSTVIQFADRVDAIITGTLYPAICRVADRTDVLFESFVKSNRLALMWAMPFGVGLALFADELVRFGIGERWHDAVPLLRAFGLIAAFNHLGFNWTAYFRARAETRPIAVASAITTVAFVLVTLPLLIFGGLEGFAYGMAAMAAVQLACRGFYLRRLFDGFRLLPHALRAVTPVIPGAAGGPRGAGRWTRAARGARRSRPARTLRRSSWRGCTVVAERALLREALGYLRRPGPDAGRLPRRSSSLADRAPVRSGPHPRPARGRARARRRRLGCAAAPGRPRPGHPPVRDPRRPGVVRPGPRALHEDTWHLADICDRDPWPFADDQFDFAVCVTTLEDIRDPIGACRELSRVAKAGYVEVPTVEAELIYNVEGTASSSATSTTAGSATRTPSSTFPASSSGTRATWSMTTGACGCCRGGARR